MTDLSNAPVPYAVEYSDRVRESLKALGARARENGLGREFVAALRTIEDRLRIYPQFGDPLQDVVTEPGHHRIGVVPPVVVRYVVYENRRLVCVVRPMELLSRDRR
jgi:hypothetical protein